MSRPWMQVDEVDDQAWLRGLRAERHGIPLTPRERQVVGLLAVLGKRERIARRLRISPRTVGIHLHNAYEKLGVDTAAQAAALAVRQGLLE
jgi:DNA-binding CsgD family transcriptional regulator